MSSEIEIRSFKLASVVEVTPDPHDSTKCGGALCEACLILSSSRFCTVFRETIMGDRRVSRCINAQKAQVR